MRYQSNSKFELTKKEKIEGYTEEKDNEDSPIKKILIAAAIGVAGIGAYKSGMLKDSISDMIKYAGDYKSTAPAAATAFKSWSKKTTKLEHSVLRLRVRDSIRKVINNNEGAGNVLKSMYKDTRKDLKVLKKDMRKYVKKRIKYNKKDELKGYLNTDLMYNINKINTVSKRFDNKASQKASDIMKKDFLKKFKLSAKDAENKIKRTGYRAVTLDDILEVKVNKSGSFSLENKKEDFLMDAKSRKKIENFIKSTKSVDDSGEYILNKNNTPKNIFQTGDYKNLVLDKNIQINELGEIADLRQNVKDIQGFIRSASNDFKIPFVGINPLKFFGLGKVGIKEQMFETLHPQSIQPAITGLTGNKHLKDLKEFGDKRVLFSNGSAYKFDDNKKDFIKIKEHLTLKKYSNGRVIDETANDYRKMADIRVRDYEEYTKEDGMFKYFKGKISKFLDIGRQDSKSRKYEESLINAISPNNIVEKASDKLFSKMNFTKSTKTDSLYKAFGDMGDDENNYEEIYVAIKKHIKWKDVMDPLNSESIKTYFTQFVKGRKDIANVTESSIKTYHLFERMNQAFKPFGLALGMDSIGSTKDVISGMLLKRFLPIYAAGQGIEYLTYLSETEDEDGNKNNIQKELANQVKKIELGATRVKDAVGLTDLFKGMKDSMPGYESLSELPIVKNVGLDRNFEEQSQWYETGMNTVRKGRYWDLGNTAFIGGKVTNFEANWYRKTMADADFSENKYGSRKEYFQNTWYPTPTNPFAPIKHFITDKYHYDEKQYYNRPYLMTSPEFENVPLAGPLLSSTIGKVIKPQIKMHDEYWNGPYGTNTMASSSFDVDYNTDIENGNNNSISDDNELFTNNSVENVKAGNENTIKNKYVGSTLGVVPKNLSDDGKEIYITNSGNIGFIDIDRENLDNIKFNMKTKSPKSMLGVNTAPNRDPLSHLVGRGENGELINENGEEIINPNDLKESIGSQYMNTTNVLGLYGYLTNTYVTGTVGDKKDVIDTPGYAYSYNKEFWDKNVGGFGGDISEIFRRFVQKRRKDVEYYNPIRNTQPEWMSGDNYFVDFKSGDPFAKIADGESRLAGTPYENLWGLSDPLKLGIGSSSIGKTKDEIVDHYLQNDTITDEGLNDIVDTGTKMHEKIEQEWMRDGLAVEVEGKIEDKKNNIVGYYDAKIHDETSNTGFAMVDIKTISDKGFNEIIESGKAKELHQKQVNYYLWATGNDKGYVHYVNRDNPEQRYTAGFEYSEGLLNDTFKNLSDAREEIMTMYNNKQISRGDLYKPLDRLRILADVAPWSQEFAEMDNVVKASTMDKETKLQYDEIKERVKLQKKPHNTYEYRYKNAEVESINTKITKVRGTELYTEASGDKSVKLAGINLGVTGDAEEKRKIEDITKNLQVGSDVKLLVDKDEVRRNKGQTLKAVVLDEKGVNINKKLINENVAEEDKDDYSAPAMHAKYSKNQMFFGSMWERFAHMDTPLHTKFLQVRSAKEDYERREVYGVDFARWQEPVEDFLKPALYSAINRPSGIIFGGILGHFFGKTKFGKFAGTLAGMGAVMVGKLGVGLKEKLTGEKWIPENVEKERNLVEYMDTLKFVKNQNLYNHYKKRSLEEEGFDLDTYEQNKEKDADKRKNITNSLKKGKVDIKDNYEEAIDKKKEHIADKPKKYKNTNIKILDKILNTKEEIDEFFYNRKLNKLTEKSDNAREKFSEVNKKINGVSSYRDIEVLPELATKALEYKDKAEKTIYGYDVGEPLTNLLSALPKVDRDRMKYFLDAPEHERSELLQIVPDYVKRTLQSSWGMKVDKKPTLEEFFGEHQLPDTNWEGWDENVDLDSIKVKMINKEGLDYSDFNVWDDDLEKADALQNVPLPTVNFRNSAIDIKNRLSKLLNDVGVQDVQIDYNFTDSNAKVDMDLKYDSKKEVEKKINEQNYI